MPDAYSETWPSFGGGDELIAPFGRLVGVRVDQSGGARRDDVDSGAEQFDVVGDRQRVALGTAGGVDDAIGLERDQCVGIGGDGQADRVAVGQFACVLAVLLR